MSKIVLAQIGKTIPYRDWNDIPCEGVVWSAAPGNGWWLTDDGKFVYVRHVSDRQHGGHYKQTSPPEDRS
jgi:hypothetical protein